MILEGFPPQHVSPLYQFVCFQRVQEMEHVYGGQPVKSTSAVILEAGIQITITLQCATSTIKKVQTTILLLYKTLFSQCNKGLIITECGLIHQWHIAFISLLIIIDLL